MQTESLYTSEDAKQEAYLVAVEKNVSYSVAHYWARMKRGRESLKLARGYEPYIEQISALDSTPEEPSLLFLAFVQELNRRQLLPIIEKIAHDTPNS